MKQPSENIHLKAILYAARVFLILAVSSTMIGWDLPWLSQRVRGDSDFNKGNFEQAIGHYERSVDRDGEDWETLYNLGTSYYKSGRWQDAVDKLEWAAVVADEWDAPDPQRAQILHNLGLSYLQLNDCGNAVPNLQMAAELDEHNEDILTNMAFADQYCAEDGPEDADDEEGEEEEQGQGEEEDDEQGQSNEGEQNDENEVEQDSSCDDGEEQGESGESDDEQNPENDDGDGEEQGGEGGESEGEDQSEDSQNTEEQGEGEEQNQDENEPSPDEENQDTDEQGGQCDEQQNDESEQSGDEDSADDGQPENEDGDSDETEPNAGEGEEETEDNDGNQDEKDSSGEGEDEDAESEEPQDSDTGENAGNAEEQGDLREIPEDGLALSDAQVDEILRQMMNRERQYAPRYFDNHFGDGDYLDDESLYDMFRRVFLGVPNENAIEEPDDGIDW